MNDYGGHWCRFCVAILVVFLSGCAGPIDAPERINGASGRGSDGSETYVVSRGDTMYSIAWDRGLDYRMLAKWNDIKPPYLIHPGQRLYFNDSGRMGTVRYWQVKKGDTLYSIARRFDLDFKALARWNAISTPYRITPGQRLRLAEPGPERQGAGQYQKSHKQSASRQKEQNNDNVPGKKVTRWVWPTDGKIISHYSGNSGSKGIDIAGTRGQEIRAAAEGTVVYQGSGLRGYGKLIIIKHNADFLSAYAHCQSIYVKEGNVIQRGQRIAEMGDTGSKAVKLHFEIRYRGEPVNPLKYLPKI